MNSTYTLYSMQDSGNCYKARLMLHLRSLPFRLVDIDIRDGTTRQPDFMALNPNGKVPLLVLPDGRPLAESNAMLLHLAEGTDYLPGDAYERALCYQWLFFEQYSHEPAIAVARYWLHLIPDGRVKIADRLPDLTKRGHAALAVMDQHLADRNWFAGNAISIADIALYAYTHVADEGGFDLTPYPSVRAWLARTAARPDHVAMDWRP
jgi:glutathione S-transferase